MKKTLIALAALTAGAAFAQSQSSVTLYGAADAYIGSTSTTLPNAALGMGALMYNSPFTPYVKNTQSVVNSGGLSPSRLGISVKEDLGNEMRAFANFESELQTDTGTSNQTRTSVVGLGSSLGSISIGRQATPLKDGVDKLVDAQGDSTFSAFTRAAAVSITNNKSPYTARVNSSVRYDLPDNLNGFRGALIAGKATSSSAPGPVKDRIFGLSLGYVQPGSWAIGFAHQTEQNGQNTVPVGVGGTGLTVGGNKITIDYLAGAVATPVGKVTLGFGGGSVAGVTGHDRGWNIGWMAPVGSWTFVAQYAAFKANGQLGNLYNTGNQLLVSPPLPTLRTGGVKRSSFGVEAHYSLSKRTTLYTGYNQTKNVLGIDGAKASVFGVGMRHDF